MLNSKIINIYLDNNPENATIEYIKLDKLQIELNLDNYSRFVIQFDDILLSCAACELEREKEKIKLTKEYQLYLKKFNRIKESYLLKKQSLVANARGGGGGANRSSTNSSSNSNSKKVSKTKKNNETSKSAENKSSANINCKLNFIEARHDELIGTISTLIGCIGCRVSVERFYKQLIKNSEIISKLNETIYPILIDANENLTLNSSLFLVDPFKLYSIFYLNNCIFKNELKSSSLSTSSSTMVNSSIYTNSNGSVGLNTNVIITTTTTTKTTNNASFVANSGSGNNGNKNRRCQLHSLDKAKLKSINDWLPVWHSFIHEECRSKFILIDTASLFLTLQNYLLKHKFCSDCKLKVIRAFNLLIGELDSSKEKGFCASLYEGLECCTISDCAENNYSSADCHEKTSTNTTHHLPTKHLHLINSKEFVGNLIYKAELEIHGSRRERHAKTLDIAQEEVLTCIGIYLYEKFHRVYQLIKQEEQTWQLLLYSSALTLKKSFELEFEKLQGVSNLDLICAELEAEKSVEVKKLSIKNARKAASNKKKNGSSSSRNGSNELSRKVTSQHIQRQSSRSSSSNQVNSSEDEGMNDEEEEEDEEETAQSQDQLIDVLLEPPEACECSSHEVGGDSSRCNGGRDDSLFSSLISSSCSSSSTASNKTVGNYSFCCLNYDCDCNDELNECDEGLMITEEEKNEYYANKTSLLNERKNHRELLKQQFQNLKLSSSFKIRPRKFS